MSQPTVFISYSHDNEDWKNRVKDQLSVLDKQGILKLEVWDDRRIKGGEDWLPNILMAIKRSNVVILLISDKFLISEFIRDHEIPQILALRSMKRTTVIPLIIKPCGWKEVKWLEPIQCRPINGTPLSTLPECQADEALTALTNEVADLLRTSTAEEDKLASLIHPGTITGSIKYPDVDHPSLKTDVGSRWGLWRHPLWGIISGPDGLSLSLFQLLTKVETLLQQAMAEQSAVKLLLRRWHLLEASPPPHSVEEMNQLLQARPNQGIPEATLLGLIITITVPQKKAGALVRPGQELRTQLTQWHQALSNYLPQKANPVIICLIRGGTDAQLREAAERLSRAGAPTEFLKADPLLYGRDPLLDEWHSTKPTIELRDANEVLVLFDSILSDPEHEHAMGTSPPSADELLKALMEIPLNDEGRGDRFRQLLSKVFECRPRLLEPIISMTASCADPVLEEISLRFAKRDDHLLDTWLQARRDDNAGSLFRPDWIERIDYGADPSSGESFVKDLALGLARMIKESHRDPAAMEWMQSLLEQDILSQPLGQILRDYVLGSKDPLVLLHPPPEAKKIMLAFRSGCLNELPSEIFPLHPDNPFPFWLAMARPPTSSWLSRLLSLPLPSRSAFGLTTELEEAGLDHNAKGKIMECRRASALPHLPQSTRRSHHAG